MPYHHQPVLLKEVIGLLDPREGENFIDATLGGGGYSLALFDSIAPSGKLLSIDLDIDAIKNFQFPNKFQTDSKNLILHHGNFSQIDKIVVRHQFENIKGIVADLGFSSYELENRGLSFQAKQLLDMRFDQSQDLNAKFIVNNYSTPSLERLFKEYGEEKFAGRVARKIQEAKTKGFKVNSTADLFKLILEALPKPVKHKVDDSARRIFQALRIAVNHELENLREFLPKAFDLLSPGGRLAIVCFHSLEDRVVKQYFLSLSKGCVCPPEFPICRCGRNPKARLLTKKPIVPSLDEQRSNSRSKPAKLRAVAKI